MNRYFKHGVLRAYIALAREEKFIPSEIGETIEFVAPYSGRTVGEYPVVQLEYSTEEKTRERICEQLEISTDEYFNRMIFPRPSRIQNILYSAELRRVFGVETLRFIPEFDREGNFILLNYRGFYEPEISGNQIVAIKFNDFRAKIYKRQQLKAA